MPWWGWVVLIAAAVVVAIVAFTVYAGFVLLKALMSGRRGL